jgi:putative flippase GtrA
MALSSRLPNWVRRPWLRLEGLGVFVLGLMGMTPLVARQLIRFLAVGLLAAITYVWAMSLMIDGWGVRVLVAAFFSFVLGTAVSFLGNALWSFEARPTVDKAIVFFTINTIGLCLNMAIAWLLELMGIHYLLISLTVLIVVPMFNFVGHRLLTFGPRTK